MRCARWALHWARSAARLGSRACRAALAWVRRGFGADLGTAGALLLALAPSNAALNVLAASTSKPVRLLKKLL